MLSDPDRYPARTVPPILILAWTGTVVLCLLRESAGAAEPETDEPAAAPQLQDPSKAERPHPAQELRRHLQEYRRHRQRNAPREPEPEEGDGTHGSPGHGQRNLTASEAAGPGTTGPGTTGPGTSGPRTTGQGTAQAGSSTAPLAGGPFTGFLTAASIGNLFGPFVGAPRTTTGVSSVDSRAGLPAGPQAGAVGSPLPAPLASPYITPIAPPLTAGLFEMSAGPVKGPVFRQRRPPTGAGAGMRLNELERALLRQQLREVLRVPGGRDTR